jgi:hypothetical protein
MRVDNGAVTSEPEITDPASLLLCSIIRIPGLSDSVRIRRYDTISIRLGTTGTEHLTSPQLKRCTSAGNWEPVDLPALGGSSLFSLTGSLGTSPSPDLSESPRAIFGWLTGCSATGGVICKLLGWILGRSRGLRSQKLVSQKCQTAAR